MNQEAPVIDLFRGTSKFELLKSRRYCLLGLPMTFGGGSGLLACWSGQPLPNAQSVPLIALSAALLLLGLHFGRRFLLVRNQLNEYL